jgi:polyribonucleotide nucleotidyltransferase
MEPNNTFGGTPKSVSVEIGGRTLTIETGRYAFQATGSATVQLGDTIVLAAATLADTPREGCDFFPLTVDYEEKYYASGKIKGSRFIKREGRPSENAILRCRMIDRPIRPMFPKGMTNDVQIIASVISCDQEVDPGISAITAASAALLMAGAPIAAPVAGVKIGFIDGQFVVNPTYTQEKEGQLSLNVAGTPEAITMVEAGAKELPEDKMLEALELAHAEIKKICQMQLDLAAQVQPKQFTNTILRAENAAAVAAAAAFATKELLDTVAGKSKKEVKEPLHALEDQLLAKHAAEIEAEQFSAGELKAALGKLLDKNMRANILEKDTRIDGRALDEVRPLYTAAGVLPRTHGTGLFQRGETQILSIATLGSPGKAQIIDTMDVDEERFYMHHYNFPPYSTGEAKPMRGTSRREVGHGDLGERALIPVLPAREQFPYAIRVVSETLSCNGSSSMGSVCGSTMALMDAGVPILRPVSGIAMGLVTDKDADGKFQTYKILSDIQGLEDFAGDMDFKVTGTTEGITALQMDIKVKGLSVDILREALNQAKRGRQQILDKMLEAIAAPRAELSKYAPMIEAIKIDPELIGTVIGKGGETIRAITKECEVEVDVSDDGLVTITALDQAKGAKAKKWILQLITVPEVGEEFDGKVVKTMDFGAFIQLVPGKDGMLHISALQQGRTERVEDAVKVGDPVRVKILEIDPMGRINLGRVLEDGTVLKPAPKGPPRDGPGGRPPRRF